MAEGVALYYAVKLYQLLVGPTDRVVVTDFVATTFCFSTFRSCSLEKTDTYTAALFFPKRNCLISPRERSIILADKLLSKCEGT